MVLCGIQLTGGEYMVAALKRLYSPTAFTVRWQTDLINAHFIVIWAAAPLLISCLHLLCGEYRRWSKRPIVLHYTQAPGDTGARKDKSDCANMSLQWWIEAFSQVWIICHILSELSVLTLFLKQSLWTFYKSLANLLKQKRRKKQIQ